MPSSQHTGLPDPDAARRVISESLTDLAGRIADQMQHHANATPRVPYDLRDWLVNMENILSRMPGDFKKFKARGTSYSAAGGDVRSMTGGQILGYILPSEYWNGAFPGSVPRDRLEARLKELRAGLVGLANILRTISPPALPRHKPPAFARLRDDVVAASVADQLAALISEGRLCYEKVVDDRFNPSPSFGPGWDFQCHRILGAFLTTEVPQRFAEATDGLQGMEVIGHYDSGQFSSLFQRIHAAFIAIALDYLTEVLELMPKYAEDSGQGKRRDPVVYNTYLPNAQGVIVGEQQNFTQNNTTGVDPRAFIQLAGYVGQISSALGMVEPDRVELERVTQELHDEATSDAPQVSRLRQLAGQIKDRLLEAGATMAATVGIQMAEQAIGTLVQ
ncbi:hypothetical protein ACFRFU_52925 [Streptomyces sp. NPDC056704]|uniref:hypothetical protein n=1 Tax=Streptomyces sp. NPDC056704 TaxID=3345917 RepID=UPI0036C7AB05